MKSINSGNGRLGREITIWHEIVLGHRRVRGINRFMFKSRNEDASAQGEVGIPEAR